MTLHSEAAAGTVGRAASGIGRTLSEKVWDSHVIRRDGDIPDLLYIDLHLIHEVTSPQAFEGLRASGRTVRRPEQTLATMDHSVPTRGLLDGTLDQGAARQLRALRVNAKQFDVPLYPLGDPRQGIVHIIGPDMGLTLPGTTVVCGDSHTATHGAFGAIAFGIGTSQVEHVLATQTLPQERPQTLSVTVTGRLGHGVTAKDLILGIIATIGVDGGTGAIIEYRGEAIRRLPMEGRMTVCNMSIEAGARAGMIAPDDTTFAFLDGRRFAPKGRQWDEAVTSWRALATDDTARFDRSVDIDAAAVRPFVTWGTDPSQVVPIDAQVPDPGQFPQGRVRDRAWLALSYMGLTPGTPMREIPVDVVFIGSCTNGRLDDLRAAARVVAGHRISERVRALVVPGSSQVKELAEAEGLDRVFTSAGFEWRSAGCSMCCAMNGDIVGPGERCLSTSNRNFEGRQGPGARTHLASPAVAAATALAGVLSAPES